VVEASRTFRVVDGVGEIEREVPGHHGQFAHGALLDGWSCFH
jgi:hypothetical protein